MTALSDHKTIGKLFLVASVTFAVVGGALGLLMRAQVPDAGSYRQLFTLHGVVMIFLFLLPAWLGLASAVVPLQVGARRVAFPRTHALSFWLFVAGAAMVISSPLVSDVVSGWTLDSPLPVGDTSGGRGQGPELLILGLILVAVAAVATAANLIVTMLQLRAPELSLRRIPLFSWSVLVSSAVMLMALPVLIGALMMLFVDRHYGGQIFSSAANKGGDPLLWPRLFWFGAYPLLWALVIPALGAMCEIIPVFARRTLASHSRAVAAIGAIGVLALAGWGSEIPELAPPLFALGALAVLAPVAAVLLNILGTLRGTQVAGMGSKPVRLGSVPPLAVLTGITVAAAGLMGALVSAIDAGGSTHFSTWSVATQHLLFFGVSVVGVLAATHFWAPKLWGRHLAEGAGKFSLLALVGGLHLAFLPMFLLGLGGAAAGEAGSGSSPLEAISTAGAFALAFGLLLFAANFLTSAVAGWGREAEADPWGGFTLEWATSSPPPPHNFDELPALASATPLLDVASQLEASQLELESVH